MVYPISLFFFILFSKRQAFTKFLLYLPVIDAIHNFMPKVVGYNYLIIITMAIVYLNIYYYYGKVKNERIHSKSINNIINIFCFILCLSLLNSTNLSISFPLVLHFVNVLLAFKAYYLIFLNQNDPLKTADTFFKNCMLAALMWLIYVLGCTFFKYGIVRDDYGIKSPIYLGNANFFTLYPWCYLLMSYLYFTYTTKRKYLYFLLIALTLLVLALISKRTYLYIILISVILGLMFYFIKARNKSNALILIGIYILLFNVFSTSLDMYFFSARGTALERSYLEEGRYFELLSYRTEFLNRETYISILFGKEIFNSQGKFFHTSRTFLRNDQDRILHSDLAHILYGTGLVGTSMYILVYYFLQKFSRQVYSKTTFMSKQKILIYLIFWSVYLSLLFNNLSDGILAFSNRVFPFAIMGASLGLLNKLTAENTATNQ